MNSSSFLRILTAIFIGVMLISSGVFGRPGSILGALIDAGDMAV